MTSTLLDNVVLILTSKVHCVKYHLMKMLIRKILHWEHVTVALGTILVFVLFVGISHRLAVKKSPLLGEGFFMPSFVQIESDKV